MKEVPFWWPQNIRRQGPLSIRNYMPITNLKRCRKKHWWFNLGKYSGIFSGLKLIPLTSRIWWAPNNASKWQMGFNSLNAELNPICHLLALLWTHHIFHVRGLRVNSAFKDSIRNYMPIMNLKRCRKKHWWLNLGKYSGIFFWIKTNPANVENMVSS